MPKYFSVYWTNDTWERESQEPRHRLTLAAGNQFGGGRIAAGDLVYVVTVLDGTLYVAGRMRVEEVLDKPAAMNRFGRDIWEAEHYVVSTPEASTIVVFDKAVDRRDVTAIRCISGDAEEPLAMNGDGGLDQQTLRRLRQLSPDSARILDRYMAEEPFQANRIDFVVGATYTREDIGRLLGLAANATTGGDWATGYHEHAGQMFVFAGIGSPGRTGHDYGNRWDGDDLVWYGRTQSSIRDQKIQRMLNGQATVRIFTRNRDRERFRYEGIGVAKDIADSTPVRIVWEIENANAELPVALTTPDVGRFVEGAIRVVPVSIRERNPVARRRCIEHYGSKCAVCEFDFAASYGAIGVDYIHVHHLEELAAANGVRQVDPVRDLRPVCPNCHAMLHTKRPSWSIPELQAQLLRRF